MTTHARHVLSDCERLLAAIDQDMPGELWRPRWAGLVALLRAVGHVLKNVDGARSPEARKVIAEAWKELQLSKPEPQIFWEFVEAERNNVLKAYAFSTGVNITVRPGGGTSPSGPTTFNAFMRSGPFKSQDPLRLCGEAIAFWHAYLDTIDLRVSERQSGPAV